MSQAQAVAKPRIRVPAGSSRRPQSSNSLVRERMPSSAYAAGDPFEPAFAATRSISGSADRDWLAVRLEAIARCRDVIANDPVAASGLEQKLSLIVGDGWKFESMPDYRAFNLDPTSDEYEALSDSIETVWREVTEDPLFRGDYEERLPYDLQLDMQVRQYSGPEGEAFALLPFVDDGWWGTKLQVIDAERVAQPAGRPDTDSCRAGIEYDDRGRPIRCHVLDGHPYDIGLGSLNRFTGRWIDKIADWTPTATRPQWIHIMKPRRPGLTRGISDYMASLSTFQYLRDLNKAELRTRLINALIVAQYTSQTNDPETLGEILGTQKSGQELLDLRSEYYETAGLTQVAGSRIIQNFPGDKLEWNSEMRAATAFADVAAFMGVQAGAGIGLGYSLMTRDFSKTTFSSARTEINDSVRQTRRERNIVRHLGVRPYRLAVLQEAYEAGRLALPKGAPSIWDAPGAYLAGTDIGPGREYVDPVKEATGDRLEMENMSASPSDIAARRGQSLEEVAIRSSRDRRMLERHNLSMGDVRDFVSANAEHSSRDAADA